MKFRRLFPDVPADLAALGDEELASLLSGFRTVSAKLAAKEIDILEALDAPEGTTIADASVEVMEQWKEAAEVVKQIQAVQTEREAGRLAFDEAAAEMHAQFGDDDTTETVDDDDAAETPAEPVEELAAEDDKSEEEEGDSDGDEDEGDKPDEEKEEATHGLAVDAPEPVVAAAAVTPVYPNVGRRYAQPRAEDEDSRFGELVLVAAGGHSSARVNPGESLTRSEYAEAVVRIVRSLGPVQKVKGGSRQRILIASAAEKSPEEFTFHAGDREGNAEKVRAQPGFFRGEKALQALMAAGGICAPPEPIYTLPGFGTTARPVKAYLGTFNAPRGAVSIPNVTTIADYTIDADGASVEGGITFITADEDAEGGTFATKSCAAMDCPEWVDCEVGIVAHCREFGNLNARTWPEGVAHENDNTMVLLARTSEGRLLHQMDALMLDVTGQATYGASSSLVYNLVLARLGIINTLRLDPGTRVEALLPFWAADMFAADVMHGATGGGDSRWDTPASAVSGILARYGIDVAWHIDEDPQGTSEIFEAEVDGSTINDWPGSTVIARVSLPNTFIRLDTGELELGLVRDSDLNHLNNYELFGEFFESVCRVGPITATRRVTLTVCPDGTIAAPDTSPFTCAAS